MNLHILYIAKPTSLLDIEKRKWLWLWYSTWKTSAEPPRQEWRARETISSFSWKFPHLAEKYIFWKLRGGESDSQTPSHALLSQSFWANHIQNLAQHVNPEDDPKQNSLPRQQSQDRLETDQNTRALADRNWNRKGWGKGDMRVRGKTRIKVWQGCIRDAMLPLMMADSTGTPGQEQGGPPGGGGSWWEPSPCYWFFSMTTTFY